MSSSAAIWSVVRGESRLAHAVEPVTADLDIPDEVLAWAVTHGLNDEDPDLYLLVAPADEAGEVGGEIAYREFPIAGDDLARLRAAVNSAG